MGCVSLVVRRTFGAGAEVDGPGCASLILSAGVVGIEKCIEERLDWKDDSSSSAIFGRHGV